MFKKELLIGFSTILGWSPSLILVLAAIFSSLTGFVAFLNQDWAIGLLLSFVGTTGVIGFIALTSVCWGLKLDFFLRFIFLVCGVVSLATVITFGFFGSIGWFTLRISWVTIYLYFCPLLIGIIHAGLHANHLMKFRDSQI
jgi:hypothetical protein